MSSSSLMSYLMLDRFYFIFDTSPLSRDTPPGERAKLCKRMNNVMKLKERRKRKTIEKFTGKYVNLHNLFHFAIKNLWNIRRTSIVLCSFILAFWHQIEHYVSFVFVSFNTATSDTIGKPLWRSTHQWPLLQVYKRCHKPFSQFFRRGFRLLGDTKVGSIDRHI